MFQYFRNVSPTLPAALSIFALALLPIAAQAEELPASKAKADLERLYEGLMSTKAGLFTATP